MRFATIWTGSTLSGARIDGERLVLTNAANALDAFVHRDTLIDVGEADPTTSRYAPVSPAPAHILCVGLNYHSHIADLKLPNPTYPTLFAKYTSTLTGAYEPITLPSISDRIDVEVELAIVIGTRIYRGNRAEATQAIAGYTVANDLSMRDWQHRTTESLQGKVFDHSTPLGPILVTPDEIDHARNLELSTTLDGVRWQHGTTSDLLFTPDELVSYCSTFLTLQPGDVILTGTPGKTCPAHDSVHPAQTLTTTIEGIGSTINLLTAETGPASRHPPVAHRILA